MAWTQQANIRGPQGPKGDKGDQGDPGADGKGIEYCRQRAHLRGATHGSGRA